MERIKIISIFKINEKVPFMTCIATDMEESEDGIKPCWKVMKASALKITVITSCQKLTVIWTENK